MSLIIPELIGFLTDRDPIIRGLCVPLLTKMAEKSEEDLCCPLSVSDGLKARYDGAMKQHIQKLPWRSSDPDDRLRAATALSEISKFGQLLGRIALCR